MNRAHIEALIVALATLGVLVLMSENYWRGFL